MSKKHHLCDWDRKEIEKDMLVLISIVKNPKYICKKCARAANTDVVLCKPYKIKKSLLSKTG